MAHFLEQFRTKKKNAIKKIVAMSQSNGMVCSQIYSKERTSTAGDTTH